MTPTLTTNARKCASFFKKRGYPDCAVTTGKHRAQEIDRETALQTSQNEETDRIPFTLTYHPQNRHFQKLQNSPQRSRNLTHIFSTTTHFIQTRQKLTQFFSQERIQV